jgi:hypothetical protein
MKIFQLIAVIGSFILVTANASAQMRDPNQVAQTATNTIKQNVTGITPAQESQVYDTELDYTKKVQTIFKTSDLADKAAIESKIQPLRAARDAKMKSIFTADQDKQYELSKPEYSGGIR